MKIRKCKECDKTISKGSKLGFCKSCSHKSTRNINFGGLSEKHKQNLRKACKGRLSSFKGRTHTKEAKLKNRLSHLGKKIPSIQGDKNPAKRPEVRAKMSKSRKARKITQEQKDKTSASMKGQHAGSKNPAYIDGRSSLSESIRNTIEYKRWRMSCFHRDTYTCQECESRYLLEVHHTKSFNIILQEFLEYYNIFSPIEDKETLVRLAILWDDFWNINYGMTLCKKCHKILHPNYNF